MPAVIGLAIGFVAGDLAGLLRPGAAWWLGVALATLGLAAWRRRAGWAIALTAAAAGTLWGAAAGSRAGRDCRVHWREGERIAVAVELWDLPEARASRATVRWPAACAGPITVVWPPVGREARPAGAAVVVGTWHRSAGRAASSWPARPARSGRVVAQRFRALRALPGRRARLRLAAERRIRALFGPRRAPLAAALTVGTGDQLDAEIHRRFARAGIAHLLAISGLHVGILAGAALLLLRAARLGAAPARAVAATLAAGYVWVLGLPPPALRALGLLAIWAAARLRSRPLVPGSALAATALAVTALDPFAAVEAGPWLSFAGAWGCAAAARHWARLRREHRGRWERWLAGALVIAVVSGGATLATAPFSILAFGTMSPAALAANPLAVPLAGILMPSLALTLAVSAVAPTAATIPAAAAAAGLDAMDRVAGLAGSMPLASLAFERRLAAAAVAALVAAILLRPRRAGPRQRALGALAGRGSVAGGVLVAAAIWWPLLPSPSGYRPDALALHFLAVGQGDATAIRTPRGRWIVVDGGPRTRGFDAGASVVAPFLQGRGAKEVALLVASHGEADHLGGLPAVVRRFRPALVLEPGEPLPTPTYRRFLAALAKAGSRWHPARAGDSVEVDGVGLRVLHPNGAWLERGLPPNENSVVVAVQYGAFRALLMGDAGLRAETAPGLSDPPRAAVLKIAHHGSRTATGPAFLRAVAPAACVVSAGPNRYGQPDPAVLRELARSGCGVFRTDAGGTVTVETDGRSVRIHAGDRDTTFNSTREQP